MNKKIMILTSFFIAACTPNKNLLDKKLRPTDPLRVLLNETHIPYEMNRPAVEALSQLVRATQNKKTGWLRSGERWEWEHYDNVVTPNNVNPILAELDRLDMIHGVNPQKKSYDQVVILGALASTVQERIGFMIHLWNQGIRWNTLVFLASERPIAMNTPEKDLKADVIRSGYPPTEYGVMRYIVDHMSLPNELRALPQLWVNTPTPPSKKRADTEDSFDAWFDRPACHVVLGHPELPHKDMSVLAISNAPFIQRQGYGLKIFLHARNIIAETVGSGLDTSRSSGPVATAFLCLSEIAKELYMIDQLVKKGIVKPE